MFGAKKLPVVVIVLESNLGKFAGIESQVRGNACAFTSEYIVWIICGFVAIDVFTTHSCDPTRLEAPEHLRIEAPVAQRLGRQRCGCVGLGLKPLIERFGLP